MKLINRFSLSETIELLKTGKLDYFQVIDIACERLKKIDKIIKSFLPENDRCNRVKKDLEQLLNRESINDLSLLGIPIGIKDLFYVEGFTTLAGSKLPSVAFKGEEGSLIKKIKKLGGLIFGKTITTEFAYFSPGPTVNPHNILHTPGGSSSGSAAAVAAGIVPLAFGTQTIGSISRPASFCGVVGFKPTYDRISRDGFWPFAPSVDHVGFFTQDLEGAEFVASLLCENWNDFSLDLEKVNCGVPIGKYLAQADEKILSSFSEYLRSISSSEINIVFVESVKNIEEINKLHSDLIAYEFAKVHKNNFEKYGKWYSSKSIELIKKGKTISKEEYKEILVKKRELTIEFENLTANIKIDVWLSPSAVGVAPKGISSTGNPIMNLPWTFFGFPTLSLPAGFINKMPWNIQVAALRNDDEKLFAIGHRIWEEFDE